MMAMIVLDEHEKRGMRRLKVRDAPDDEPQHPRDNFSEHLTTFYRPQPRASLWHFEKLLSFDEKVKFDGIKQFFSL